MKQQLLAMLEMQDAMNTKVNDNWRDRNFEWYRAIWIESAELLDHYGWKWWKKQTPDRDQVILELVDIWHFGLSIVLSKYDDVSDASDAVINALVFPSQKGDVRDEVEAFAEATLASKGFDIAGFARLMVAAELDFEELYRRYVGKNVLNFFRQEHGYKDGTYKKTWAGKEDNEHLVEAVAQLDANESGFKDALYQALEQKYAELA